MREAVAAAAAAAVSAGMLREERSSHPAANLKMHGPDPGDASRSRKQRSY